jgi:hypothetical protein
VKCCRGNKLFRRSFLRGEITGEYGFKWIWIKNIVWFVKLKSRFKGIVGFEGIRIGIGG